MPSGSRKRLLTDVAYYLLGGGLYAASVNVFTAPGGIAPGGLTGLSTLLHHLIGTPIGVMILVMNLPLFWASWRYLGRGFTLRTAAVTSLLSVFIDLCALILPPFHGDRTVAALFGGALSGVGLGLIYMRGATTGGSELIARLLERRLRHIPIGRLILLVDAVVIAAAALVYGALEAALYAALAIYVSTALMDSLIYGAQKNKVLLLVTREGDAVARAVMTRLERGVTLLPAKGAYTGADRQLLLCAVRPSEVYALRTLAQEIDPDAFIIVATGDTVFGEGFNDK